MHRERSRRADRAGRGVAPTRVPTDAPEADGTYAWDQHDARRRRGRRRRARRASATPTPTRPTAPLIRDTLRRRRRRPRRDGRPAPGRRWSRAVRNLGRPGVASMAISAVDTALWDLKARLLGLPLVDAARRGARRACRSTAAAASPPTPTSSCTRSSAAGSREGIPRVKMKIGTRARRTTSTASARPARRSATRPSCSSTPTAPTRASRRWRCAEQLRRAAASPGSRSRSPPTTSTGLRLLRDRAPAGMEIAAGEYGYDPFYFRRMLEAGAVDVLQADATRCGGITGLPPGRRALRGVRLAALGALRAVAARPRRAARSPRLRHLEYFHDHDRIEHMLFDGAPQPARRRLIRPDRSRPGSGSSFKRRTPRGSRSRRGCAMAEHAPRLRRQRDDGAAYRAAIGSQPGAIEPRPSTDAASSTPRRSPPRSGRDRRRGPLRRGSRALYATDGSNYRQVPIGVVIPRDHRRRGRDGRGLPRARRADPLARRRHQPGRAVLQRRRRDRLLEVPARVLEIDPDAAPRARRSRACVLDDLRARGRARTTSPSAPTRRPTTTARSAA